VNDCSVSEELRRAAYRFGRRDAEAKARWQHSLEQELWGKVLPGCTLEQKAVVLSEYGRGWRAVGSDLSFGRAPPRHG
jgi:hypothetical protein